MAGCGYAACRAMLLHMILLAPGPPLPKPLSPVRLVNYHVLDVSDLW